MKPFLVELRLDVPPDFSLACVIHTDRLGEADRGTLLVQPIPDDEIGISGQLH